MRAHGLQDAPDFRLGPHRLQLDALRLQDLVSPASSSCGKIMFLILSFSSLGAFLLPLGFRVAAPRLLNGSLQVLLEFGVQGRGGLPLGRRDVEHEAVAHLQGQGLGGLQVCHATLQLGEVTWVRRLLVGPRAAQVDVLDLLRVGVALGNDPREPLRVPLDQVVVLARGLRLPPAEDFGAERWVDGPPFESPPSPAHF